MRFDVVWGKRPPERRWFANNNNLKAKKEQEGAENLFLFYIFLQEDLTLNIIRIIWRSDPEAAITSGALFAGAGIALGAFGAHALKGILGPESLSVFETGVRYQMYHAFGILMLGIGGIARPRIYAPLWRWSIRLFTIGILLFSGSLLALALTQLRWIGAITPLGGLCFIAGWLAAALGVTRNRPAS
jgi:uncharacterized membrane protein YgdD (TMEM256/DUF423 family)